MSYKLGFVLHLGPKVLKLNSSCKFESTSRTDEGLGLPCIIADVLENKRIQVSNMSRV